MALNSTRLLRRLNPYCVQALSAAASLCQSRAHGQISIEHWLLKLLEQGEGDLTLIARRYEWDTRRGTWADEDHGRHLAQVRAASGCGQH